jgi:hypothetical protein
VALERNFFRKEQIMNKKLLFVVVILTALALTGSALALAPMGPPTAGLKTGQFRAGAEYSYSDMDFKADWGGGEYTAKNVKVNIWTANLGYGIMDDWEGFVRLGAANAEGESLDFGSAKGDYGFAWGLGTKYTFLKQDNLDWGVLFQINWLKSDFSHSGVVPPDGEEGYSWKETANLDAYDIEIALGPTWKAAEGISVYGGPFFNIIRGNADYDYVETPDTGYNDSSSLDIKEKSLFGGYVGVQWDFMQSAAALAEFQFTGAGWTFATGVGWKF